MMEIAADLIGEPITGIERARPGANNQVYRLSTATRAVAIKFYPQHSDDCSERLHREYTGLEFMTRHGIDVVPRPIACSPENHCAAYEWIAGDAVTDPTAADIDAMVALATRLAELRNADGAAQLSPASASCLAEDDAIEQTRTRFDRLRDIAPSEPALDRFLMDDLGPAIGRAELALRGQRGSGGTPVGQRTLSPSDFGFHNALRRHDGTLVFLDFEYFGWDDATKMVADVLLHPGSNASSELKQQFFIRLEPIFDPGGDGSFRQRVGQLYPVFGLIWCLILLNEFLPEKWVRRSAARGGERNAAKSRQLRRAKTLFDSLNADGVALFTI